MALLQFKTALVDPMTVQTLTGLSSRRIEMGLEDGTFAAFHLERRDATSRTLPRIVPASVVDFLEGRQTSGFDLLRWFNANFPAPHDPRAAVVAHNLVVSQELVTRLIVERDLLLVPGSKPRRGPGGSPRVSRASLLRFLKKREIGAI